jgi:beta-xylosidase
MIDQQHPITPPPELVAQWLKQFYGPAELRLRPLTPGEASLHVATAAAQWGADQELEACCEVMRERGLHPEYLRDLRAARRPKPPSLKEQALEAAQRFYAKGHEGCTDEEVKDDFDAICRALEALDD